MARGDAPLTYTRWIDDNGHPTQFFYQFLLDLWRRGDDEDSSLVGPLAQIKKLAQKFGNKSETRYIELNEPSLEWKCRLAFLRRYGYGLANNDIILNTDADIILDKKVKKYISKIGKNGIGIISFSYMDYPLTIQYFIRKLTLKLPLVDGFTGQFLFSKEAWLETDDEESVKQIISNEDIYLRKLICERYKRFHVETKSIHLRPRRTKADNYMRGVVRWNEYTRSLGSTVISSIIYLRPATIVGYLHARRQDTPIKELKKLENE